MLPASLWYLRLTSNTPCLNFRKIRRNKVVICLLTNLSLKEYKQACGLIELHIEVGLLNLKVVTGASYLLVSGNSYK